LWRTLFLDVVKSADCKRLDVVCGEVRSFHLPALSSRIGREDRLNHCRLGHEDFLGCLGEKGESAYEFLYRERQTRYYRLVCGGLEGVCGRFDAVSGCRELCFRIGIKMPIVKVVVCGEVERCFWMGSK